MKLQNRSTWRRPVEASANAVETLCQLLHLYTDHPKAGFQENYRTSLIELLNVLFTVINIPSRLKETSASAFKFQLPNLILELWTPAQPQEVSICFLNLVSCLIQGEYTDSEHAAGHSLTLLEPTFRFLRTTEDESIHEVAGPILVTLSSLRKVPLEFMTQIQVLLEEAQETTVGSPSITIIKKALMCCPRLIGSPTEKRDLTAQLLTPLLIRLLQNERFQSIILMFIPYFCITPKACAIFFQHKGITVLLSLLKPNDLLFGKALANSFILTNAICDHDIFVQIAADCHFLRRLFMCMKIFSMQSGFLRIAFNRSTAYGNCLGIIRDFGLETQTPGTNPWVEYLYTRYRTLFVDENLQPRKPIFQPVAEAFSEMFEQLP